jgi:lysophospholipase L1-like esterase
MKPNIVLILVGTNDMKLSESQAGPYDEAPTRYGHLVDSIHKKLPDSVIVVSKLPHLKKKEEDDRINTFNSKMEDVVVKPRVKKGWKVRVADLSVVKKEQLVDGTHP